MSQGLGSNFDRAQRAYDNRMPEDEPDIQCDTCDGEGSWKTSNCCNVDTFHKEVEKGNNVLFCSKCLQPCGYHVCEECSGTGVK